MDNYYTFRFAISDKFINEKYEEKCEIAYDSGDEIPTKDEVEAQLLDELSDEYEKHDVILSHGVWNKYENCYEILFERYSDFFCDKCGGFSYGFGIMFCPKCIKDILLKDNRIIIV